MCVRERESGCVCVCVCVSVCVGGGYNVYECVSMCSVLHT